MLDKMVLVAGTKKTHGLQEIRHRIASAHESLSNILSLVDSYTPVIITTKTIVEAIKPHLRV